MTGFEARLPDLVARLRIDSKGAYDDASRGALGAGKSIGRNLGRGITAGASVGIAGLAAGVYGVTKVLKEGTAEASDWTESLNKAQVVFGKQQGKNLAGWAKQQNAIGLSDSAALGALGTFGNLTRAIGLSEGKSAEMSKTLVTLGADLASFNNTSRDEALEALRSGLTGETEPLKRYGVAINEALIQSTALNMGLVKTSVDMTKVRGARIKLLKAERDAVRVSKESRATDLDKAEAAQKVVEAEAALAKAMEGSKVDLTAAQKSQAVYALILDQTSLASGDATRSLKTSLANQKAMLDSQRADLFKQVGNATMPAQLQWTRALTEDVLPALSRNLKKFKPEIKEFVDSLGDKGENLGGRFADWLDDDAADDITNVKENIEEMVDDLGRLKGKVTPVAEAIRDGFSDAYAEVKPLAEDALPLLNETMDGTRRIAKKLEPILTGMLDGFDALPKWAKVALGTTIAGGLVLKKINSAVGGDGLGGGLRGTRVLPVWVKVVGGFPGGGGGKGGGGGTYIGDPRDKDKKPDRNSRKNDDPDKPGTRRTPKPSRIPKIPKLPGPLGIATSLAFGLSGGGDVVDTLKGAATFFAAEAAIKNPATILPAAGAFVLNGAFQRQVREGASDEASAGILEEEDLIKRLNSPVMKKYAESLNIDIDALEKDIRSGDRSMFLETLQRLNGNIDSTGDYIAGWLGEATPGWESTASKSMEALEELNAVWNSYGTFLRNQERSAESYQALIDNLPKGFKSAPSVPRGYGPQSLNDFGALPTPTDRKPMRRNDGVGGSPERKTERDIVRSTTYEFNVTVPQTSIGDIVRNGRNLAMTAGDLW